MPSTFQRPNHWSEYERVRNWYLHKPGEITGKTKQVRRCWSEEVDEKDQKYKYSPSTNEIRTKKIGGRLTHWRSHPGKYSSKLKKEYDLKVYWQNFYWSEMWCVFIQVRFRDSQI